MIAPFRLIAAVVCTVASMQCAGLVAPQSSGTSAITGTVRDGSGTGVAEASVRLQPQGDARAEERKTDTSGNFGFSGLKTGTYVLSASKGERHSVEVTVSITTTGAVQRADLALSDNERQKAQMEFSDTPNFTVEAVTGWTAATRGAWIGYDRLGENDRAVEEFRQHDELEKEQAASVDRQRKEAKQVFVLAGGDAREKDRAAVACPHAGGCAAMIPSPSRIVRI